MSGRFDFDLQAQDYGVATDAIRAILTEWAAVDWFVPPVDDAAAARAVGLFEEHHALARAALPDLFPARIETRTVRGGWAEFQQLCDRVSKPGGEWDWKYSALKKVSFEHSKARGWSIQDQRPPLASQDSLRPGALFIRIGKAVVWGGVNPKPAFRERWPPDATPSASWYMGYAIIDFYDRIQWHLAEQSNDASGNPFVPLTRCYGEGFYPFGLSPSEFVLFSFAR